MRTPHFVISLCGREGVVYNYYSFTSANAVLFHGHEGVVLVVLLLHAREAAVLLCGREGVVQVVLLLRIREATVLLCRRKE